MDFRYLWSALVLTIALGAWEYVYGYNGAAALLWPFVVLVLVFLALLGESPSRKATHWFSDRPMH